MLSVHCFWVLELLKVRLAATEYLRLRSPGKKLTTFARANNYGKEVKEKTFDHIRERKKLVDKFKTQQKTKFESFS